MDSFLPPLITPCCSPAMPLVLHPRPLPHPPLAVDFSGIIPDRLAGRPAEALAGMMVLADGRSCPLESLFHLQGSPADEVLHLAGDFSHVHSIGAKMARGMIRVEGSVGRHAAEGMTGGRLEVAGDAGDWLAAAYASGVVRVWPADDAATSAAVAPPPLCLPTSAAHAFLAGTGHAHGQGHHGHHSSHSGHGHNPQHLHHSSSHASLGLGPPAAAASFSWESPLAWRSRRRLPPSISRITCFLPRLHLTHYHTINTCLFVKF